MCTLRESTPVHVVPNLIVFSGIACVKHFYKSKVSFLAAGNIVSIFGNYSKLFLRVKKYQDFNSIFRGFPLLESWAEGRIKCTAYGFRFGVILATFTFFHCTESEVFH